MASFAMQLGRRYPTPLFWNKTREHKVFGPYILQEVERQVRVVRMNLRIARSRQKSKCHLCEAYDVSWYELSSHLGSLVHSRSRKREKTSSRRNF
jgi:hypothetical protein